LESNLVQAGVHSGMGHQAAAPLRARPARVPWSAESNVLGLAPGNTLSKSVATCPAPVGTVCDLP
jgi:hypothetical protein